VRKCGRESSLTDIRRKSGAVKDKCALEILIQASRQASHSAGIRWFLQAASGKGAKGGRAFGCRVILNFWRRLQQQSADFELIERNSKVAE